MGQAWDGAHEIAFQPETWHEVYRVLKPGGFLVAMGGTRTYHRLATAIEDAGFEMRDSIAEWYDASDSARAFLDSLTPDQLDLLARAMPADNLSAFMYGSGFPKGRRWFDLDVLPDIEQQLREQGVVGEIRWK